MTFVEWTRKLSTESIEEKLAACRIASQAIDEDEKRAVGIRDSIRVYENELAERALLEEILW